MFKLLTILNRHPSKIFFFSPISLSPPLISYHLFFFLSIFPPSGQPAAPAEGAAPLRPAGQAEPGPVLGPARAAAAGHQHHVAGRLVRAAAGRQRERKEEDAGQVSVVGPELHVLTVYTHTRARTPVPSQFQATVPCANVLAGSEPPGLMTRSVGRLGSRLLIVMGQN